MIYTTMQINLKCILPNPQTTYFMISFSWHSGRDKTIDAEDRQKVAGGWGLGQWVPTKGKNLGIIRTVLNDTVVLDT